MKQSIGSGRGSVYNIILKALQSGDKYGYEICQEIETKTNGNYILKQPSLYSGLKRLEAQKLVRSYWGDSDIGGRRHYYSLTQEGKQKIEQSNFTWEDERNDLVENFFQKSESDKMISEIKQEIEQLNESVASANQENKAIEQTLASNEKTTQNNQFAHKVSNQQFDLFSFVNHNEELKDGHKIESNILNNEEHKTYDKLQDEVEYKTENNNLEDSRVYNQEHDNQIQFHQLDDDKIKNENEKILEDDPTVVDAYIDFDKIFNRTSAKSFSEHIEEKTSTPISLNDLEKSSTFYGSSQNTNELNEQKNDDFDAQYEKFQKMFEEPIPTPNQEEKQNSQKTEQVDDEYARFLQEKRMSDALSGNLTESQNELPKFDQNVEESSVSIKQEEQVFNLKSIFGDVIADSTKNLNQDEHYTNFENFNDTNFGNISETNNEQIKETNDALNEDLPRYDMMDNINLSLDTHNSNHISHIEVNEQYQNSNFTPQYSNTKFNNKPFDEKYEQKYINEQSKTISNYHIRYLRKNNIETMPTHFTAINKLNFSIASIFCSLLIALTLGLFFGVSAHTNISLWQNACYIINIILCVTILFYYTIVYFRDKNYKIEYNFEKRKFIVRLIVGIIVAILIFVLNCLYGMTIKNINEYLATMLIPVMDIIFVILSPIIKFLLNKIPYYAK